MWEAERITCFFSNFCFDLTRCHYYVLWPWSKYEISNSNTEYLYFDWTKTQTWWLLSMRLWFEPRSVVPAMRANITIQRQIKERCSDVVLIGRKKRVWLNCRLFHTHFRVQVLLIKSAEVKSSTQLLHRYRFTLILMYEFCSLLKTLLWLWNAEQQ